MYTFLFLAALALLALGIVLTWLRARAQQESKAVAYAPIKHEVAVMAEACRGIWTADGHIASRVEPGKKYRFIAVHGGDEFDIVEDES
jgi:hypothetical protein